jgi:hypothetical protein
MGALPIHQWGSWVGSGCVVAVAVGVDAAVSVGKTGAVAVNMGVGSTAVVGGGDCVRLACTVGSACEQALARISMRPVRIWTALCFIIYFSLILRISGETFTVK